MSNRKNKENKTKKGDLVVVDVIVVFIGTGPQFRHVVVVGVALFQLAARPTKRKSKSKKTKMILLDGSLFFFIAQGTDSQGLKLFKIRLLKSKQNM